jgi:Xaa-Pro aminopeptidase
LLAGAGLEQDQAIVFCREKNPEREVWDGERQSPEQLCSALGMDAAYPIHSMQEHLRQLLACRGAVFIRFTQLERLDPPLGSWLPRSGANGSVSLSLHDLEPILDEMRLIKDPTEIGTMRQAAKISAQAHRRAMQACTPGIKEYHLEAELLHEFRSQGAESVAYNSIVATGAHACVLHHRAGDATLLAGELCLIDAACEWRGYAADITRTFPVNGRFSSAQRELYELVLAAQEAAIAATRPGTKVSGPHEAAIAVLAQGMLDVGLLNPQLVGTVEDVLAKQDYTRFYMHRTSHWLGMDVHDCGSYRELRDRCEEEGKLPPWRILQPGMAMTIEPGIYVRPGPDVPERYWHIGIRIEDDVVLTENGCDVISRDVPVGVQEIEALMAEGRASRA